MLKKPLNDITIGIIGLGYVGLPLALAFGKTINCIGFDINRKRIKNLNNFVDNNLDFSEEEIAAANKLHLTYHEDEIKKCDVYIITVPTPIDEHKQPDLSFLENACQLIGKYLTEQNVVIFESTVYPGATEEFCVPVLEKTSNLKFNKSFYVGYSPERVNPGDKKHTIENIVKVTSGSNSEAASFIDKLYAKIITAGTYQASSIKVAEAAKVIENTQRDINIALINELAVIFDKLNIDTNEVLDAASTKWNFLNFLPGLVGGHCIGVDPYYLTHKATAIGHHPQLILAGRRLNDSMGFFVAAKIIKLMTKKSINPAKAKILILGFTFKENCPDIRNTKVIDLVNELCSYEANVDIHDPLASVEEAKSAYGISILNQMPTNIQYDVIILAVAHKHFTSIKVDNIKSLLKPKHVIYDLKNTLPKTIVDGRL